MKIFTISKLKRLGVSVICSRDRDRVGQLIILLLMVFKTRLASPKSGMRNKSDEK